MFDVANHGGSVDRPAAGFPLSSILSRVVLGYALLLVGCWCAGARAGTLYQCTGASGEVAYTSSKVGYHGCKAISTYVAPTPRRQVPARPISVTGVTGAVETTARNLGADGAEPTSLVNVQGSARTSAHELDETKVQRVSLAAVQGSVESAAISPIAIGTRVPPSIGDGKSSSTVSSATALVSAGTSAIRRTYYYKVVHADGSLYLGDHQPQIQKGDLLTKTFVEYIQTCFACDLHSPIRWGSVALNLTAYSDTIRAASIEYGVDEAFLRAIIHAESAFNPRALSLKGAQGLMQLMPGTASNMGVLDAFNTDQNIRGGARYLSLLLHDFNGNEELAAAAYNAGPAAVQRYSGVPPYAETRVYVVRVGTLRKRYGLALHPPLASSGPH
jgi:hypothetical protein